MTACRCAMALAALAAASTSESSAQDAIQYEFGLVVTENQVADGGVGGDLADLAVGTTGVLTILVNTDRTIFPPDSLDTQYYQIFNLSVAIGHLSSASAPGVYPSQSFVQGFGVTNDSGGGSSFVDILAAVTAFDNPEFGFSAFAMSERLTSGATPQMLQSTDLPLSLDVSLSNGPDFSILSPLHGTRRVYCDVTSAEIAVIPAPASGFGALAVSFVICRRR